MVLLALVVPAAVNCGPSVAEVPTGIRMTDLRSLQGPVVTGLEGGPPRELRKQPTGHRETGFWPTAERLLKNDVWARHSTLRRTFGFDSGPVWVRLGIANAGESRDLVVISESAWVDRHDFFAFDSRGVALTRQLAGDSVTRAGDVWPHLYPAFRLTLPAHDTVQVLIRYESRGSVSTPVRIVSIAQMRQAAFWEYTTQTLLFSILFLVALYGAGAFAITRYVPVGYFALMMLAGSYLHLVLSGLGQDLFFPAGGYALNEGMLVAAVVGLVGSLGFTRTFLELWKHAPWFDRAVRLLEYFFAGVALLALVPIFYTHITYAMNYVALAVHMLPAIGGLALAFRRVSGAATVAIAFAIGVTGALIEGLATLAVIDSNDISLMGIRLGLLGEGLWLALAIGLRLRWISAARVRAQAALETVDQELQQAEAIHSRLLPARLPEFDGATFSVRYRPAERLGGDFYALESIGERAALVFVADVTGRGLPAALDSALLRVSFRNAVARSKEPAELLAEMSQFLAANLPGQMPTAICMRLDVAARAIVVAAAGHPAGLLIGRDSREQLATDGPMLGLLPDWKYEQRHWQVPAGSYLLLFTDGLVAPMSLERPRSPHEVILDSCPTEPPHSTDELADEIWRRCLAQGSTGDDATLVLVDMR